MRYGRFSVLFSTPLQAYALPGVGSGLDSFRLNPAFHCQVL